MAGKHHIPLSAIINPHPYAAERHTDFDKERPDIIVDGQSGRPLDKNVAEKCLQRQ